MRDLGSYAIVSGSYGAFTVTDGALRTLVLLYLHSLGYRPLELATLFLLYEFFGVVTNLLGGWLGARFGLKATLFSGMALQIIACSVLAWRAESLSLPLVMTCQGLSGVAKDLTKMSSKSFVKLVVPEDDHAGLLRWVTLITGSKNTLKGVGFLLGGVALEAVGFAASCIGMVALVSAGLVASMLGLPRAAGKTAAKKPLRAVFSDDARINWLAAARFFLFGSRDLWFAVALPVFLAATLGWSFPQVSAFLALWIIGYGAVQAAAPRFIHRPESDPRAAGAVLGWSAALLFPLAAIGIGLQQGLPAATTLILGLAAFGIVFAVDSALHSFLIVAYAESESVAMRVGFYYMANAGGRLVGMFLSGALFQAAGLGLRGLLACLVASGLFVALSALLCLPLGAAERKAGALSA